MNHKLEVQITTDPNAVIGQKNPAERYADLLLDDAKALARKMRNTEIRIIEKCGHICSIEKWSVFNRIVLDFLSGNVANMKIAGSN